MSIASAASTGACRTLSLLLLATSLTLMWPADATSAGNGDFAKVGPELQALYEAHRMAHEQGRPLVLPDPSMQVVEDRVTVDAVAAGRVEDLKAGLVALGMRSTVTAGRIVSGQIPIVQIPNMAVLPELRFVRAAMSATH